MKRRPDYFFPTFPGNFSNLAHSFHPISERSEKHFRPDIYHSTKSNHMSNSSNASILVAGATGYLGSEICRQLISKNKRVKGLVRATSNPDKVAQLKDSGVEMVIGDLKNRSSLEDALHDKVWLMVGI